MAKLPKMTPEMAKAEEAHYQQELKDLERKKRLMQEMDIISKGPEVTPPPLNPDGSLKDEKDE